MAVGILVVSVEVLVGTLGLFDVFGSIAVVKFGARSCVKFAAMSLGEVEVVE